MSGKFIKNTAGASAVSLLALLLRGFPLIGQVALFVSVSPQLVLYSRGRKKEAFISWVVVCGVMYLAEGGLFLGLYAALFLLYGLWYIKVLSIKSRPAERIILACAGWVFLASATMASVSFLTGINPVEEIVLALKTFVGGIAKMYIDAGMAQLGTALEGGLEFILAGFAGFIGALALGGSWLVYIIITRWGGVRPGIVPEKFRIPEQMVWILLAAAVFFIAGNRLGGGFFLEMTGANLGAFLLALYFGGGLAVSLFLMRRWHINRNMGFIIIVALIMFGGGIYLFTALGIADIWLDFRKREIKGKN